MTERRSVGDEVLDDIEGLLKTGSMASVTTPPRTYSTPTKLGREMLEGAGATIAKQKQDIDRLESERKDGMVVLRLDPKLIRRGQFANRLDDSLSSTDEKFAQLKKRIQAEGQHTPIRVTPLAGDPQYEYEIVFGHRRHAVCLELDRENPAGFPVFALLDATAADARHHVLRMHSENADRQDLSPFEYGRMYTSWLTAKVFRSQEEIAAAVGLDRTMVTTYIAVARLPEPILEAFGDRRLIAVRWARELTAALKLNERKVIAAAQEIASRPLPRDPIAVMRELAHAAKPDTPRTATKTETVKVRGKTLYTMNQNGGRLLLKFGSLVDQKLAAEARDELKDYLTRWLSKRVKT